MVLRSARVFVQPPQTSVLVLCNNRNAIKWKRPNKWRERLNNMNRNELDWRRCLQMFCSSFTSCSSPDGGSAWQAVCATTAPSCSPIRESVLIHKWVNLHIPIRSSLIDGVFENNTKLNNWRRCTRRSKPTEHKGVFTPALLGSD